MTHIKKLAVPTLILVGTLILPQLGICDVEGTLGNIQDTLINKLMPLFGVLGLCYAGFSFVSGKPEAKSHMLMAIVGVILGFAAPSIIDFVRGMVQ